MRRETLILLRPALLALVVPLAATAAIAVLSAARPAYAPPGPAAGDERSGDLAAPGATKDSGEASAACGATGAAPRAHPCGPGRLPSGPETAPAARSLSP